MRARFDVQDPVLAAAAWSRLTEPGDTVAGALVAAAGATGALAWVFAAADLGAERDRAVRRLFEHLELVGAEALPDGVPGRRLSAAVARWSPRLETLDPRRELSVLASLDGTLVLPGSDAWPVGLADLGTAAPHCLWVRGDAGRELLTRSAALVGARACTDYGTTVAADLAGGLADRGFCVVSGGAYGIDAAAHRGALAAQGASVAVLAGGVDRLYPAGNSALLERLVSDGGAVVSETPPGSVPSRSRFLQRNRLIAAVTRATVVVEAAWRSGSLSTAARAADLLRPVGAVPGPVTSMASAGCHRLLREQQAVCVTDAAEVAELVGDPEPASRAEDARDRASARPHDGLGPAGRRVLDALAVRRALGAEALARAAGLAVNEVLTGLGELELRGLAHADGDGWRRGSAR